MAEYGARHATHGDTKPSIFEVIGQENLFTGLGFDFRHNLKMRVLVLGVYAESSDNDIKITSHSNGFKELDKKCNGQLLEILNKTGPLHKPEKTKLLWLSMLNAVTSESRSDCLSIVDLGNKNAEDKSREGMNQRSDDVRCAIVSVAEAANLIVRAYDQLKQMSSKSKNRLHLQYENIHVIAEFVILAEGQKFARLLLMETPANHMTPSIFASTFSEKFKNTPVKVIVRYREWAVAMNMGSLLSVASGSEEPLKFLELHYHGLPGSEENVAFVDKAITFDAGGISLLKPASNMDKMRADMGGAACVVGTIPPVSALNLKNNVKGFTLLTESLPSGKATKPGDVVFETNGKSIQVDNTDSEGSLVLDEALCYAKNFNPKAVEDIRSFTAKRQSIQKYEEVKEMIRQTIRNVEESTKDLYESIEEMEKLKRLAIKACAKWKKVYFQMLENRDEALRDIIEKMEESVIKFALGAGSAGIFSNDGELWNTLNKVGYILGDRDWRMLLYRLYLNQIAESISANLNNICDSTYIRLLVAAAFLQEIVNSGTKLDIDEVYYLRHEMDVRCELIEEIEAKKREVSECYEDAKKFELKTIKWVAENNERLRKMIAENEERICQMIEFEEEISRQLSSLAE